MYRRKNSRIMRVGRFCCFSLFLTFLVSACDRTENVVHENKIRPVKTMVLEKADRGFVRSFPGTVRAAQRVNLAFNVPGPVVDLPVIEGQSVEKGELLARIDPRDFEKELEKVSKSLEEAKARLRAMKTGARPEDVTILESQVTAARARLEEAETNFQRWETLYKKGAGSKMKRDNALKKREVARADLNTALQNLKKGKKGAREEDIEAMESNIQALETQKAGARDAVDDTYMSAPFSGNIDRIYVEKFQHVQAKEQILSLQDISSVEVVINIPERVMALSKNRTRYKAEASFEFLPSRTFEVEFKEFSVESDPQTQTYEAVLSMTQPQGVNILPGMTATVTIKEINGPEDMDETIFLVPVNAVFADPDGGPTQYVWVVDQDTMKVHKRQVEVADLSGDDIRITKGLSAGERIVTAGVNQMQEDMEVRLLEGKIGS